MKFVVNAIMGVILGSLPGAIAGAFVGYLWCGGGYGAMGWFPFIFFGTLVGSVIGFIIKVDYAERRELTVRRIEQRERDL
jgi:hypothetical protein